MAFLIIARPQGRLGTYIARGLTTLGLLATFILEIPSAWKVLHGGAMPEGAAFVSTPQAGA